MLMGKFLGITAALLLAAGCVAPVSGYYGGYGDGGNSGYYDPSSGYGYGGYGYSSPVPTYGYSYGYPGSNATTVYNSRTVVYPQSSGYQQPVYYPGATATSVSNPPSSHWRRRQAQYHNYHRGRPNQYHQGGSTNYPGQGSVGASHGNPPGPAPGLSATNGPRPHFRGQNPNGAQTQAALTRHHRRQHQAVNTPGPPSGLGAQGHRPQARPAPARGPVMSRPMAQANPGPAMAAPRPMANANGGSRPRSSQGQGQQSRQKKGGQGSQ